MGTSMAKVAGVQTQRVKLVDLKKAEYNPRRMSSTALEGLRKSIQRYGIVDPIVINKRNNTIVGGHQRVTVLESEGYTETDVVILDLGEHEERALNILLNDRYVRGTFTPGLESLIEDIKKNVTNIPLEWSFEKLKQENRDPSEGAGLEDLDPSRDFVDYVKLKIKVSKEDASEVRKHLKELSEAYNVKIK